MEKYNLLEKLNPYYYEVRETQNNVIVRRKGNSQIVLAMRKVRTSEGERIKMYVNQNSFPNMIRSI